MRFIGVMIMLSVLGTVQAQIKITDYLVFSHNGHSIVFFNESGEHVLFTTYKNNEVEVQDLWANNRERKNAIISQIVDKNPTIFEVKNLKPIDVSSLVARKYTVKNDKIYIRFLQNDSYEILDDSDTIFEQGHYYMSNNESILNFTNVDGDYIGAIISKERLLMVIGETVFHLSVKNE